MNDSGCLSIRLVLGGKKRQFGLISPPLSSVNKGQCRPTGEASPEVERFAFRLHVTSSPQNTGEVDPRRRHRAKLANLAN